MDDFVPKNLLEVQGNSTLNMIKPWSPPDWLGFRISPAFFHESHPSLSSKDASSMAV